MYGNPLAQRLCCSSLWEPGPLLDVGWRTQVTCGGSKGHIPETQGFLALSFGDPLRQVVWPSAPSQSSKEPDSDLRPELAVGALEVYAVTAPDASVLREHMTWNQQTGLE